MRLPDQATPLRYSLELTLVPGATEFAGVVHIDLQIKTVKVIDIKDDDTVIKCLKKDPTHDTEEALKDIYRRLRPEEREAVS